MLEKYEKNFDENEFVRSFMERKQISTKKQALAELRKLIKKEGYYQTKIKEALMKRYPDAFVAKISQGAYSQAGIPDVMFIKDGHYFGFEVKRPVVGIRSKLQEQTARMIQAAGGTAAFVCWPGLPSSSLLSSLMSFLLYPVLVLLDPCFLRSVCFLRTLRLGFGLSFVLQV